MRKFVAMMLGLLLICSVAIPATAAVAGARVAGGAVTDELGRPIAGAEVEVYRLGQGLTAVLTTNASGGFTVAGAPTPGALWQLRASAKGYRTLDTGWIDLAGHPYQPLRLEPLDGALRVTAVDGSGNPAVAYLLVIGPGGQVAADQLLTDGRAELKDLTPGQYRVELRSGTATPVAKTVTVTAGSTAPVYAVLSPATLTFSGEVRDGDTGLPVAGAQVQLLRDDQTVLIDGMTTDGEGRFRLGYGPGESGALKVRVWAPGYRPATTAPITLAPGQGKDYSGQDAILLAPRRATVAGTVLTFDGHARQGIQVILEAKGYGQITAQNTAEDGTFEFMVKNADPATQYRVYIMADNEVAATGWMTLADGVTDQIVLQTKVGTTSAFGAGSLAGAVVDPAGAPVAGATVELFRRNHLIRTLTTDKDGSFLAENVDATRGPWTTADPFTVRVSADGFVTTTQFTAGGQAATEVQVAVNGRSAIRVPLAVATTTLWGRVIGNQGEPIATAEVYLMDAPGASVGTMVRSDANGWYTLPNVPVGPGVRYTLTAKAKGYRYVGGVDVAPAVAERQTVPTLRMTAEGATFAGQVTDPNGMPVPGAKVELRDPDGLARASAVADANGLYRLTAPLRATGPLTLVASLYDWQAAAVPVTDAVTPGATVTRDLVLIRRAGDIGGRVLDANGNPVYGVVVELLQEGRGVIAAPMSDGLGVYHVGAVDLTGGGWFWLRNRTPGVTFGGSLRHGTEIVPLLQLVPGQDVVTDLLVTR